MGLLRLANTSIDKLITCSKVPCLFKKRVSVFESQQQISRVLTHKHASALVPRDDHLQLQRSPHGVEATETHVTYRSMLIEDDRQREAVGPGLQKHDTSEFHDVEMTRGEEEYPGCV